jgi:hypothetical protein
MVKTVQPTYVYLLYKGQASVRATIIYPAATHEAVLVPARYKIQSDVFKAEPPSGTDIVLAVASKTPVQWMKDADAVDSFFEYAVRSLSAANNANGLTLHAVPADAPHDADSPLYVVSIAVQQD